MWTESTPIPNSLQESRKNLERILLNWILIEWMVEMMVNESNGLGFVVQIGNWWCTESSWGSSGCCCGSCGWWPTSTASFTRLRFIRSTCCGVLGSSAKSSTAAPESFSRGAPFSVLRPLVHSFTRSLSSTWAPNWNAVIDLGDRFLPGSMSYFHGCLHILTFNVPLLLIIGHAADNRSSLKSTKPIDSMKLIEASN